MSQVKDLPEDKQTPAPPDESPQVPSTWPKEARDAFLRKAQEAAEFRKQAEEFRKSLEEIQGRMSELERELSGRDNIIATLSQQAASVPQQYTQPYQGPPQTGVSFPQEKFDPWDSDAAERYIERKLNERDQRLAQWYAQEQAIRDQMYQWQLGLAVLWSAQIPQLLRSDPNLSMKDIQALFEHARKTGIYDLEQAYKDAFKDRMLEAERRRIAEETRREIEEKMRAQMQPPAPPIMGPGPQVPRRSVSPPPRSYAEATEQAYREGVGRIISPE